MIKNLFQMLGIFRKDRGLDEQSFDMKTYLRKDFEEMFELMGFDREFCKTTAEEKANRYIELWLKAKSAGKINCTPFVRLDALGDRVVFAIEAIEQHGYDAEIVLDEIQKEINSRDGEVVDGKFQKYETEEAKSKWYKADFHKAMR